MIIMHIYYIIVSHTSNYPTYPYVFCLLMNHTIKNYAMIAPISRLFLLILGLIFTYLSFYLLISPVEALSPHGLKLFDQPISGLAEIRAFYFGTMGLFAFQCMRGAYWNSSDWERKNSLLLAFTLLWLFVVARAYAYFVDGPPELQHAYSTWIVEVIGSSLSFLLFVLENSGEGKISKKQ